MSFLDGFKIGNELNKKQNQKYQKSDTSHPEGISGIIGTTSPRSDFYPFLSSSSTGNENGRTQDQKYQKSEPEGKKGIFGIIGDGLHGVHSRNATPQEHPEPSDSSMAEIKTDTPTPDGIALASPEAIAYRDRLLVACPDTPRAKWHVWYCSRCKKASGCGAWRHLAWEVRWYQGAAASALAGDMEALK